ncbi:hypothetical protein SVAN01_00304 [Stagonosporopsis vannaccii]|nr:hypothetical protein SVAN01_00304 [Stagonosporopsis vannaccii]
MNKLPRRVARALTLRKPCNRTPSPYTTSAPRVTSNRLCPSTQIHKRTSVHFIAPASVTRPHTNAHIPTRTMSSDADYAAFLDKANQDVAPAEQQDLSKKGYGTKSVNTSVPKALESVEEYYVSDADEPFEPVALEFEGETVSSGDLKKLLGQDEVEEVKDKGFESQYTKVFNAVKEVGNGEVKVFRVQLEGTRAEYYVVSVDTKGKKVVGLKALSVES